ncbi:NAD(+) diphosphatase [Methanosphaera sp. WGK6]|uniref:NAD(+) diphosphatase n=1 Tax=Methanosphaera sp. WGK6 TaxID=1561964 RepID=UPI00084C52B1|nr:NAD(+) diphosphatase [Methanosphaera sp. WGK6]OED29507.1 NudC [Methanosphaera sp. WGK6]
MIEESIYNNYKIDFSENHPITGESYYFIFNKNRELYLNDDESIPCADETFLEKFDKNFILYIGTYNDKPCYTVNVKTDTSFTQLKTVYDKNWKIYQMATRAVLINDWYKSHQYCGQCGTKTVIDKKDMMMLCPNCGQMHYSRIAPAIIVAINNNGKLLMAKHSYHEKINYALIAGFVEAGETIEEAVHREVTEEVGIKVKNVQYVKSQSWPFPNSLMLGFTADYDGGEIKVDGDEILKAKWFDKEDIEVPQSDMSISSWLINNYLKTH